MIVYKRIGIITHSLIPGSDQLSKQLVAAYGHQGEWWSAIGDQIDQISGEMEGTELLITIGGDGMILRGAHIAAPMGIPVLGINMGRVGFMTEIDADDAVSDLGWYLAGNARRDKRFMLMAESVNEPPLADYPLIALNDVTVARGGTLGVIEIETIVDKTRLSDYRGDGLVIATATGSTGYTLALGGSVIYPESKDFMVKPIATHMSQFGGLILESSSVLDLTVRCHSPATLSVDGLTGCLLEDGRSIRIRAASIHTTFLRRKSRSAFWENLTQRLGMRGAGLVRKSRQMTVND